jgi:hypothetical protein
MTASQLERAVRAYRNVTAKQADDLHALAHAGYTWDEDGCLIVRARLAPEDGALFVRALEASRDELQAREWSEERGSAEPRRPTSAEALVAMTDMSLRGNADTSSAGDRYQVVVHVEPAEGAYALEDGPALAPETAERIACDASIVEMVGRDGTPLSVGRRTRTIPPAMRRALQARDRRCRFPGCENRRFLHGHHIEHWAHGGETSLDNLVLLCSRHHRFVHEAGYTVRHCGEGTLEFRDSWGAAVPNVPRPPPGSSRVLLERNGDPDIDSRTCAAGHGDQMDVGHAVDALLSLAGARGAPELASEPFPGATANR